MKKLALLLVMVLMFGISCSKGKEISLKDFLMMQNEYLSSEQNEQAKERIAEKYGFTLKQYLDFEKKAENSEEIRQKLGELLQTQQNPQK